MTQWLIVPLPDDLLCIFRKEIANRSVLLLWALVVMVVVLIMISLVMIHCPGVCMTGGLPSTDLTDHYVISQLPHFLTFRPEKVLINNSKQFNFQ